jgi:hypothetical protein
MNDILAVLVKALATIVVGALALSPTWIYLGIKNMLDPQGFWQNFVLIGAGFWILGGLQILLIILGVVVIFFIVTYQSGLHLRRRRTN